MSISISFFNVSSLPIRPFLTLEYPKYSSICSAFWDLLPKQHTYFLFILCSYCRNLAKARVTSNLNYAYVTLTHLPDSSLIPLWPDFPHLVPQNLQPRLSSYSHSAHRLKFKSYHGISTPSTLWSHLTFSFLKRFMGPSHLLFTEVPLLRKPFFLLPCTPFAFASLNYTLFTVSSEIVF